MEKLRNCRICFEDEIPLRVIVGTHLQEMFESLTLMPLETKDLRSTLACYICCARLQNCYQLRVNCLQSEALFTQILSRNVVESVEHKNLYKNAIRIAHPVVQLSIEDDLQLTSCSDGDKEASLDVDDERMIEDRQEAGYSDLGENCNDGSIQYTNTQDLLDIVKEELCDVETAGTQDIVEDIVVDKKILSLHSEDPSSMEYMKYELDENGTKMENSDLGEKSNDGSIQYTNTQDLLDIVKEELCDVETGAPVPKKPQHVLQRNLVCLGANNHKKNEQDEEIHKIEQLKSDTAIALEFKPIKNNECVIQAHDKVNNDINSFNETNRTSDHNDVPKIISEMEMRTDVPNSKTSLKGLNQHICDICEKYFSCKKYLNIHIRTHTGEKPYQCDVCKKCFIAKNDLSKHIRIHTGKQPYQCHVCKKFFNVKSHLNTHIRVHTGEKPYKCDVCKKCFRAKCNLDTHNRIHTGEKPYKCDVCKKCFNEKSSLNRHILTHTGNMPYQCHACKKCFNQKGNLNRHLYTH